MPGQTCKNHLQRRKQGWGREKALNLSVSAPLTNCNVATCWHVELSTLNLLLLWLNIYLSNSFNSSIRFYPRLSFENSLGLALHESWGVACATTEKHWCLRSIHMPVLAGRFSLANPQSHLQRRKQGWGREKALNLSVSAPLTNCSVATCWYVELSTLNLLLLWLNIYLSNSFNSSIHVFHSKIALGWPCTNLGALLAQPQKNTDV